MRTVWGMVVVCALAGAPVDAAVPSYAARVRWQPSPDGTVTGYRVYLRRAGGSLVATLDAGKPVPAADGSLAATVRGLEGCVGYGFAVAAYRADGRESVPSNEIVLAYAGAAPLLDGDADALSNAAEDRDVDCVVDPGETDPGRADTDGDGVGDAADACQGTASGAVVSPTGCSCAQIACGDGNRCNGTETCSAGVCQAGSPPVCNDGNACTTDACSATVGCVFTPIAGCTPCTGAAQCGDGNPCTADTCVGGRCQRTAVADGTSCEDGGFCNGAEVCRAGTCSAGTPVRCDDGSACTTDACDETARTCTHVPQPACCTHDADCAGTDACHTDSRCEAGTCVADAVVCPAPGPCTESLCDPALGCTTRPLADGTPCDDGNACTLGDVCSAGVCAAPDATAALVAGDAGRPTRLELRHSARGLGVGARASFEAPAGFDFAGGEVQVSVRDASGAVRWEATVPGTAFRHTARAAVYQEDHRAAGGDLTAITFRWRGERVLMSVRATLGEDTAPVQTGALQTDRDASATVAWTVKAGSRCVGGSGQCKGRGRRCR